MSNNPDSLVQQWLRQKGAPQHYQGASHNAVLQLALDASGLDVSLDDFRDALARRSVVPHQRNSAAVLKAMQAGESPGDAARFYFYILRV